MPGPTPEEQIAAIYATLSKAWGQQHWWPANSRFEVIVGAFLTQNTNWRNVEIAMGRLRCARVLSVPGIRHIPLRKLERLIRSSGYFRQKARRLKTFVEFLDVNYGSSLSTMFARPTADLREQLLLLNGIGPETADSILLYAGQHPVFVVDAYTRRISARHGIVAENVKYDDLRALFEKGLARSTVFDGPGQDLEGTSHQPSRMSVAKRTSLAQVFNEMHGLLVGVGKNHCMKSVPRCDQCPLKPLLPPLSSL